MKNIIATLAFASVLGSMPVLAQANTGSTQNETRIHAPADWDKSGGVTRLEVAVKLCPKGIPLSEGPAAYGEMSWAKYHELVLDVCVETTQQQFDAAWAGWKTPPQPQQAAAPASQEPVEQAPAAASTKEARVVLPVPTMHRPRGYQSFENVAEESLHVQTRSGKSYDLRSTGGNTRACEPPRQLVRSERCTKLGNGGIRCAFDCR